jgi:2-oxoglutarate ferredoxin oxidoreductase subunit gamma
MNDTQEIIVAGFGGQGVLSLGQILAYAAMEEGKEVSWMPSYGPEMRGGTANCIVIISSERVSSPIVTRFDSAIILNQPSAERFAPQVKAGGLFLYEQSSVVRVPTRSDIEMIGIPAIAEALKLKKAQVANMVLLGAFLAKRPLVSDGAILSALRAVLPERHHHLLPVNEEAMRIGKHCVLQHDASQTFSQATTTV